MKCPKCGSELDTGFNCPKCKAKSYKEIVSEYNTNGEKIYEKNTIKLVQPELTIDEMQEWLLSIGTTRKPMLEEIRELKHRAEIAEEALRELIAEKYENGIRPICSLEMLYEARLEQAEERLKEKEE